MRQYKLLSALLMVLPQAAWSAQMSTPVGLQQIGQKLNLRTTIIDIPAGALSQLRSSCLKARVLSGLQAGEAGELHVIDSDLIVQFQPTIRQGGLIEIKSRRVMDDAVVNLVLTSHCPLLAFSTQWTLILELNHDDLPTRLTTTSVTDSAQFRPDQRFDFNHSNSLNETRSVPVGIASSVPSGVSSIRNDQTLKTVDKLNEEQSGYVKNQLVQTTSNELTRPGQSLEINEKPVELASLNSSLSVHGLVESKPRNPDNMFDVVGNGTDGAADSDGYNTNVFILMIGLVMAAGLVWLFIKQEPAGALLRSHFKGSTRHSRSDDLFFKQAGNLDSQDKSQEPQFGSDSPHAVSEGRFIESLIGEQQVPFDDCDLSSPLVSPFKDDARETNSIKASLAVIRRADNATWNLPVEYQSLIHERNARLEVCQTFGALVMKCQLGLIELAYQEAMHGNTLSEEICSKLIDAVLGCFVDSSDLSKSEAVPDLICSYLQNKRCEISGYENRLRFENNLGALEHFAKDIYFCFHTDQWRELVEKHANKA